MKTENEIPVGELEPRDYEPPAWQPARIAPYSAIHAAHRGCNPLWKKHQGKKVRVRFCPPVENVWLGRNPECGSTQDVRIHPEDIFDPRINSLCEHQFLTD